MSAEVSRVTQLLQLWQSGRQDALDELMPLVYNQLRVLAKHHMKNESPGHTLRATELVHEAYLKLVGADPCITDRAHFYALASRMIRHILTNHGKAKRRDKRGGGAPRLTLDEGVLITEDQRDTVFEIHEALERLEAFDARKARIVELVFFGGLEQDIAAQVMQISPATLRRELRLARAWLFSELQPARGPQQHDAC